jgi:hypothetical protein
MGGTEDTRGTEGTEGIEDTRGRPTNFWHGSTAANYFLALYHSTHKMSTKPLRRGLIRVHSKGCPHCVHSQEDWDNFVQIVHSDPALSKAGFEALELLAGKQEGQSTGLTGVEIVEAMYPSVAGKLQYVPTYITVWDGFVGIKSGPHTTAKLLAAVAAARKEAERK